MQGRAFHARCKIFNSDHGFSPPHGTGCELQMSEFCARAAFSEWAQLSGIRLRHKPQPAEISKAIAPIERYRELFRASLEPPNAVLSANGLRALGNACIDARRHIWRSRASLLSPPKPLLRATGDSESQTSLKVHPGCTLSSVRYHFRELIYSVVTW